MEINRAQLQEFITIYKKEFKQELQKDEAFEIASNLINLIKVVYEENN